MSRDSVTGQTTIIHVHVEIMQIGFSRAFSSLLRNAMHYLRRKVFVYMALVWCFSPRLLFQATRCLPPPSPTCCPTFRVSRLLERYSLS